SGSAANFARQPFEQKKYDVPLCSNCPAAFAGSTVIPQTGSFDCGLRNAECGLAEREASAESSGVPLFNPPRAMTCGGGDIVSLEPARYLSGSAANFARQPFEQKKYDVPLCSNRPA